MYMMTLSPITISFCPLVTCLNYFDVGISLVMYVNGVSVVQNSSYDLRDTFWSSEKESEWRNTESASGCKERTSVSFRRICGSGLVPALSLTTLVKLGTLPNSVNLSLFICAVGLMSSALGSRGMNTARAKCVSRLYRMPVLTMINLSPGVPMHCTESQFLMPVM